MTMKMAVSMQDIEAITETHPVPPGAAAAFTHAMAESVSSQEYTGNLAVIDKPRLVGVPLILMGFREHEGVGDAPYAFVRAMLPNGKEIGFTDGGTGIHQFLVAHATRFGDDYREVEETLYDSAGKEIKQGKGVTFSRPLFCARGLQRSEYTNEAGIDAVTYWLT